MSTITNDFQNVELWNLNLAATAENRGPFLVIQKGIAPGDELQKERMFALRPDGQWVDLLHYLAAGKPEALDEVVFESSTAIMDLLGQLGPKAAVAEAAIDDAALQTWLAQSAGGDLHAKIQHWLEQYRQRHPRNGTPA